MNKFRKLFTGNPKGNSKPDKPHKTGRRTIKTLNFHTVTFSQGAGFRAPPKEDRILAIEDLYDYVHCYYPKYNTELFGDEMPSSPAQTFVVPVKERGNDQPLSASPTSDTIPMDSAGEEGQAEGHVFTRTDTGMSDTSMKSDTPGDSDLAIDKFKLFAVFDGHCGKFAATYLQYRLPFELTGGDFFKEGKYEEALKSTFAKMHDCLKKCTKYAPERPYVISFYYYVMMY